MKFREKEATPGDYQSAFLFYLGELMPEVLETLKSLVPQYEKVFGSFHFESRMNFYERLIANKTSKGSYILFNLDKNISRSEPDAPEPLINEHPIVKDFLEFQESFYKFIERFYLDKDWLKRNLFAFLYQLSTNPKSCGGLEMAGGHGYTVYSGEPLDFIFSGWEIRQDSKDFEKAATTAFKYYLSEYIEKTVKKAKADGYKLAQGRSNDFDRIQWLVIWNKSNFESILDIIQPIKDYCDLSVTYKAVWEAFDQFKKFDLPIRHYENE